MAAARKYREANPYNSLPVTMKAGYLARNAARRALVAQATPAWADLRMIESFYIEAQRKSTETGVPHEVDHIVPLNNPGVCGLHVHTNLRVITKVENRSKRNRLIEVAAWPSRPVS